MRGDTQFNDFYFLTNFNLTCNFRLDIFENLTLATSIRLRLKWQKSIDFNGITAISGSGGSKYLPTSVH